MICRIPTLKQRKSPLPNGEVKMMALSQAYPNIASRQMWRHAGPEGYKPGGCGELGHPSSASEALAVALSPGESQC